MAETNGGRLGTAVEGTIEGAKSIGINATDAVSTAAVDPVRRAAAGVISGVKVVAKKPFK